MLSFLVWFGLALSPARSGGGALGRSTLLLWRSVAERIGGGRHRLSALRALAARSSTNSTGRWLAGSLTHGLWVGYLAGALFMVVALLSAQSYTFVWETTILGVGTYTELTRLLGGLPSILGIATPDAAAVAAAQWPGSPTASDQSVWSSLLVASLVLYGLLPRIIALAATTLMTGRSIRKMTLDLSEPYHADLAIRLSPTVAMTKVVAGEDDEQPRKRHARKTALRSAPRIQDRSTCWAGRSTSLDQVGRRPAPMQVSATLGGATAAPNWTTPPKSSTPRPALRVGSLL